MKKKMDKKGVELAFNTIIIATLALIVLVVLIMIFTGMMSEIVDDIKEILQDCDEKGGTCSVNPCQEGQDSALMAKGCPAEKRHCCLPAG